MAALPDWSVVSARLSPARLAWTAAALAATVTFSHAQQGNWKPERPVEIVVPTAPGGSIDATARLMQRIWQNGRLVDVPVVVINKPGGGQSIAMSYLDQRAGDGHELLVSTMALMTGHIMGRSKVNYTDYTPLAILYGESMTLVVRPDSSLRTGRDIQEKLRSDPRSLSLAIGIAVGGSNHLALALVMKSMGIDVKKLKTVVFQANSEAMTALMGGHVDLAPLSAAQALEGVKQGRLRIIGITSERRGEGPLAAIPTWKEQGYDVVFTNTRFVLGPKGLSAAQTAYWDAAFERLVRSEEWKYEAQKGYLELDYLASGQSPQRLAVMYKQLKEAMVDAGLAKE